MTLSFSWSRTRISLICEDRVRLHELFHVYNMYKFHEIHINGHCRVAGAATHAATGMSAPNLKSGPLAHRWYHNARHRVVPPPNYVNETCWIVSKKMFLVQGLGVSNHRVATFISWGYQQRSVQLHQHCSLGEDTAWWSHPLILFPLIQLYEEPGAPVPVFFTSEKVSTYPQNPTGSPQHVHALVTSKALIPSSFSFVITFSLTDLSRLDGLGQRGGKGDKQTIAG